MMQKVPRFLGRSLRRARSGMEKVLYEEDQAQAVPEGIRLTSTGFSDGAALPARYTLDGGGVSPPLSWTGVPKETRALVLLIEDADSPTPKPITHAVVADLPASNSNLAEGALGDRYTPPDPPPGHGDHRYVFQLYALGAVGDRGIKSKSELKEALRHGRGLAKGRIIGTFRR